MNGDGIIDIGLPHNLGLLASIAARKKIAGKYFRGRIFSREDIFARGYFREKIFSREDIFAGRYFRVNSIFAKIGLTYHLAKIFQIHFSRNFPSAKIKCYTAV